MMLLSIYTGLVLIWINAILTDIGNFFSLFFRVPCFQRAGRNRNRVHFFTKNNRNFVSSIIVGVFVLENTLSYVTAADIYDNEKTPARLTKKLDRNKTNSSSSVDFSDLSKSKVQFRNLSPVPFPKLSLFSKEVEEIEILSPVNTSNMGKLNFTSIDYDDSSDEEYLEEKLNEYEEVSINDGYSSENLSKFLYSLGVHLLYSKPINQSYYIKKRKFLSGQQEDIANFEKEILKGMLSSFIKENLLFIYELKEEEIEKKVEEIIKPHSDEISTIFRECRLLSSKLKKNKERYMEELRIVNKKISYNLVRVFKDIPKKPKKNGANQNTINYVREFMEYMETQQKKL